MNIELGDFERINQMLKRLSGNLKNHRQIIQDSRCDKHDYGFNLDDRFSSWSGKISFDSWRGYYGNSSCFTAIGVGDRDTFSYYFVKALNVLRDKILNTVIELAEKDAQKHKEAALKAINQARDDILALS